MKQLPTVQTPPPSLSDVPAPLEPDEIERLSAEVRELAEQRNAVILAHNYQLAEVQDVADFTGDSLGLSRQAASTEAEVIAFCGVHFMAETAAILSPDKRVLCPTSGPAAPWPTPSPRRTCGAGGRSSPTTSRWAT